MNIIALICELGPESRDHPMLVQLNPPEDTVPVVCVWECFRYMLCSNP